jgi:hypothetical protein
LRIKLHKQLPYLVANIVEVGNRPCVHPQLPLLYSSWAPNLAGARPRVMLRDSSMCVTDAFVVVRLCACWYNCLLFHSDIYAL